MTAARGVLQPSVGLEWYEALHDNPADAKAQYANDRAAASLMASSGLPKSDMAGVDPRFTGGAK